MTHHSEVEGKYNRCDDCGRAIRIGSVVPADGLGNCPAGGTHHGLEKAHSEVEGLVGEWRRSFGKIDLNTGANPKYVDRQEDWLRAALTTYGAKEREKYDEIFAWLLGEKGDFPNLAEKPHYRFRTELRARLAALPQTDVTKN